MAEKNDDKKIEAEEKPVVSEELNDEQLEQVNGGLYKHKYPKKNPRGNNEAEFF